MLFVTDDQIDRARSERRYPRDALWFRLNVVATWHLDVNPQTLLESARGSNLFVWDAVLTDLGVVDALVEDGRYLDHALTLTAALADNGWQRANFNGHIHVPWVLSALTRLWDLHRDRLDPRSSDRLRQTMTDMAAYVDEQLGTQKWGRKNRIPWNHPTIGYCALGLAGLQLEEDPRSTRWVDDAIDCCRMFLDIGLSPAGVTWEGISYCGFVFKQLGTLLHGIEQVGRIDEVVPPGGEAEAKLRRVPHWYAHEILPRGSTLQNFNDSHADPHEALLGFLPTFARYEPRLCAAIWERLVGRSGRGTFGGRYTRSSLAEAVLWFPDEPVGPDAFTALDESFTDLEVGYVSSRSDWTPSASVLSFNAGPMRGRRHDQSDNTSFTFVMNGEQIVLDGGPWPRREEGSNSSSWGHNLVFVDGRAQRPAGEGIGVSGEILTVEHHDDHTALVGDSSESYNQEAFNPVHHARRHAVFVKHPIPYLVTYDDVQKDSHVRFYEYSLHLPAAKETRDANGSSLTVMTRESVVVGSVRVIAPTDVTFGSRPWSGSVRGTEHELWMLGTHASNPHFIVLFVPDEVALLGTMVDVQEDRIRLHLEFEYGTDELVFDRWVKDGPTVAPRLSRRACST